MKSKIACVLVICFLLSAGFAQTTTEQSWFGLILHKILFLLKEEPKIVVPTPPPVFIETPKEAPPKQPTILQTECKKLDSDVVVYESVDTMLFSNDTYSKHNATGKAILKNKSGKHRIWDINLYLTGHLSTNLTNSTIHVNELNPGEKKEYVYSIQDTVFPLGYEEKYDLYSQDAALQKYFVYGVSQPVTITFVLSNNGEKSFDVEFSRTLPALSEVKIKGASYNNSMVYWAGNLKSGQVQPITIEGNFIATDTGNFTLGSGSIGIYAESETFSGLKIEKNDAISFNKWGLKKTQDDNDRTLWHISLSFADLSDFEAKLNSVELSDSRTGAVIKTWDNMNTVIKPGESWNQNLTHSSVGMPYLKHKLSYTVLPQIGYCRKGTLVTEPKIFKVAALEMSKSLNPPSVEIGENTTIQVKIEINNAGGAPINEIAVEDEICSGFDTSNYEVTYENNTKIVNITEHAMAVPESGKMKFSLSNMKSKLGQEMQPADKITFKYTLIPNKPIAGTCRTKATGYGNTDPAGPQVRIQSEAPISIEGGLEGAEITRTMTAGANADQIKIELLWANSGASDIKNVKITDKIPVGFTMVEPKPENCNYESATNNLECNLGKVKVNEEVKIQYVVEGHGDYRAGDALVSVEE